jgi:hypothetical protein
MMILDDDSSSFFDSVANVKNYFWNVNYGLDLAYRQSSYGAVSFPPATSDVITLTLTGYTLSRYGACDYNLMRSDVRAALVGTVNDAANYNHLSIFWPNGIGCGYGLGNVNGANTWIVPKLDLSCLAHEIGQ